MSSMGRPLRAVTTALLNPTRTALSHGSHSHLLLSAAALLYVPYVLQHRSLSSRGFASVAAVVAMAAVSQSVPLSHDDVNDMNGLAVVNIASYAIPKPSDKPGRTQSRTERFGQFGEVGSAGEDAWFIAPDHNVFGVADGVGGWNDHPGADSAAYSYNLMKYANEALTSATSVRRDPVDVLTAAYARMVSRTPAIVGSTTACIVAFDASKHTLNYANLGDSGFLLYRSGAKVFRTVEQQHRFNMPFQLGTASNDRPANSQCASLSVNDGDILVIGTDGLFDNLSDDVIVQHITHFEKNNSLRPSLPEHSSRPMNALAQSLATLARTAASNPLKETPFSKSAAEAGLFFRGGKMDDITVLVAQFNYKSATNNQQQLASKL